MSVKGSLEDDCEPIKVQLLGHPSVTVGKQVHLKFRSNRILALLGYLSLSRERISRDEVARSLWPDALSDVARHNLRQTILYARQVVGAAGIGSEGSFVWLNSSIQVDVRDVYGALDLDGDSDTLPVAEAAVRAYHGEFLPGFADEWLSQPRAQLERAYVRALLVLAAQEAAVHPKNALKKLDLALQVDPLSEVVRAQKIRLLRSTGLHVAAQQEFESYKQLLHSELRIAPSPLVEIALRAEDGAQLPPKDSEMPEEWRLIARFLEGARPRQGIELAIAMTPVWIADGAASKGRLVLERVLEDFSAWISTVNHSKALLALADLRFAAGDIKEAKAQYSILADQENPPTIQARANLALVRLEAMLFRAPQALSRFQSAQAIIDLNGLEEEVFDLRRFASRVALLQNDPEQAERMALSALEAAQAMHDGIAQSQAYLDIAAANLSIGKKEEAREMARSAMNVVGNAASADAASLRTAAARFQEGMGEVDGIEAAYRRGASESAIYGTPFSTAVCLTYLGDFLSRSGRFAEAAEIHRKALKMRQLADEQLGIATSYRGLGVALIGLGRDRDARDALGESARLFLGVGALPGHASALLSLAKVELRASQPDLAIRFASRALHLLRGMSPIELRAIGPQGTQYLADAESLVQTIQSHP